MVVKDFSSLFSKVCDPGKVKNNFSTCHEQKVTCDLSWLSLKAELSLTVKIMGSLAMVI
jgi:hypothetical protein